MARLIFTDSSNQECSVYLGPDQPLVKIGRASDCSIRTSRQSVSRHHAEFSYVEGTFEVTDLNSSNGTWLIEDEQRFEISHERLEDGDEIWCGDFIVHFSLHDLPAEDPTVGGNLEVHSAQASAVRQTAQVDEASVNFGDAGLEERSSVEAIAPPQQHLSPGLANGSQGFDAQDELARLREEKQSIEELASRQTFEITDLQGQIETLNKRFDEGGRQTRSELDAAKKETRALQEENAQLLEQLHTVQQELGDVGDSADLEAAQAQCETLQTSLEQAQAERDELRAEFGRVDTELGARDTQILELEGQLDRLRGQLSNMPDIDADALQEELEKSNRLLSEYERRNADLRLEFDAQREANAALREAHTTAKQQLEQTIEAREEAEKRLALAEPARLEVEEVRGELQQSEQLCEDLRAEVQGLKQRVQLERRRNKEGGAEGSEALESELSAARERIAELEAQTSKGAPDTDGPSAAGLADARVQDLRERLGQLERLTDAIVRADLDPLSTVDRIRLQSAIRETSPKETLQGALELLEE